MFLLCLNGFLRVRGFESQTFQLDFVPFLPYYIQGEDNVLVLQTEDIVRLVLKIHENDTNII